MTSIEIIQNGIAKTTPEQAFNTIAEALSKLQTDQAGAFALMVSLEVARGVMVPAKDGKVELVK